MAAPDDHLDDFHDDGPSGPLLPPEDRLWRHPSELLSVEPPTEEETLDARRRWMSSTPTRSGAGAAGLVGALLATGVVLIGTHLTSWLTPRPAPTRHVVLAATTTQSTLTPALDASGLTAVVAAIDAALVQVIAVKGADIDDGDGVVVSSDGYVLAPASLVAGASSISVVRSDGEQLIASVRGTDPKSGLSVLRVDESGLPHVTFSSSGAYPSGSLMLVAWRSTGSFDLGVADVTTAPQMVSVGSSPAFLERCPTSLGLDGAPRGAVVVDGRGQVLAMVTEHRRGAIATPGWLAGRVARDLIRDGAVEHGWLGIRGTAASLPASTADLHGSAQWAPSVGATGVRILQVEPASAAAAAGLVDGEIITSIDGQRVTDMAALQAELYLTAPHESVRLQVVRAGAPATVEARLRPAA